MRIFGKAILWGAGVVCGIVFMSWALMFCTLTVLGLGKHKAEHQGKGVAMGMLAWPVEILDLPDQAKASFRVVRFEEGQITINPAHLNEPKVVDVLRVWVEGGDTTPGMPYWDITSKTLRAQLIPFLQSPEGRKKTFTITAHGVRPSKRFTINVD